MRSAFKRGHSEVVLTVSWIIEYLYQVDQISITTPFYKTILIWLYSFCMVSSVTTGSTLMLRLQINSLMEYLNVPPHTLFDESTKFTDKSNKYIIYNTNLIIN